MFAWPVDPGNTGRGFDRACEDWPGDPQGCFWISKDGWRDTQPFQRHLYAGFGRHLGADWNLGSGSDEAGFTVYAAADGMVTAVRTNVLGWGNIVFIRHDLRAGPHTSMYAHVEWRAAGAPTVGRRVARGEPIAVIGNAGGLYSYHLHFEIRAADNTTPGVGYTLSRVTVGPQSQVDPNAFVASDH
jgi:murein DD-endopeptidase MepM/ murein hydrolase activator NlpD